MSKFTKYDVADNLDTTEKIVAFINAAVDEDGYDGLIIALDTVARSKGMAQIADKTGLGRESLYKSLKSPDIPKFSTVAKVLNAIGLELSIKPKIANERR